MSEGIKKPRMPGRGGRRGPPIMLEDFMEQAKPLIINLDSQIKAASPKQFSSGSYGWYMNDKMVFMVNGIPVAAQVNIILTVVGSKPEEHV